MKGQRGKKAKYVVYAKKGLLEENKWRRALKNLPTELVRRIRRELARRVPDLNEKFNLNSRYFGYWRGSDEDRLYIFIQKKRLCILVCISWDFEKQIREKGFEVRFINNFQGRPGWLTGWYVPHDTKDMDTVMKYLCMAFKR
jgi:hypothetical protein